MKAFRNIVLFIGTLAIGVVIGGWCGARWSARALARMEFAKPEVDDSFLAAQESEWAAMLRLGEVGATITNLESDADIQLETIAAWDTVAPPDEHTRKARDGFLTAVKTYQESYPARGRDSASIAALLATVPSRDPKSTCNSAICRLDNLRLAKLPATTNSP